MRLPTKTEVEKAQVLDRQMDVKEGLMLAKKVDTVRLELLKEQNNLDKFRKETSVIVQNEIDNLLIQRDNLKYENDVLNKTNKLLKEPFDEEWENIRQFRISELDEKMVELDKKSISLKQKEIEISRILAENIQNKQNVINELENATTSNLEAQNKLKSANAVLENARIQQAESQSRIDAENNQLTKKTEELALVLRDIQVREAAIQKSARDLAKRERFINSKYKVLMQTQNALKK